MEIIELILNHSSPQKIENHQRIISITSHKIYITVTQLASQILWF